MMGNPQTTPSNAEDLTAQDMRALFAIFLGVMLSALDVALTLLSLPITLPLFAVAAFANGSIPRCPPWRVS